MTKSEQWLTALTAVFLAAALAVSLADRGALTVAERPAASPAATESAVISLRHDIDLNTATAQELMLLPGIGPTLAQRIIAWREEHGLFASPEELLLVEGVGEGILERIYEQTEES